MLDALKNLIAEQARLTAQRQEFSKQIAEPGSQTQKLVTFLDAGMRDLVALALHRREIPGYRH